MQFWVGLGVGVFVGLAVSVGLAVMYLAKIEDRYL